MTKVTRCPECGNLVQVAAGESPFGRRCMMCESDRLSGQVTFIAPNTI